MNKTLSILNIHPQSEYDASMISWFNSLYSVDSSINLKLFCCSFDVINPQKKFTVLPLYEAKYEYGIFFIWDILSLELAINFPNLTKIYYFQNNNIPWTKIYNINYNDWAQLFDNPKVEILTSDSTIQEIFSLTWKKPKLLSITTEALYEIL